MRIKRTAGLLAPPKSHWPASHRWRVLTIGFAANAAFSAAISGLPAAAVLMCQGYQLSTAQLGIALSAIGLGIALSELPWGMVTDRLGDRRILLAGLTLTSLVLAALALLASPGSAGVPSYPALVAGMALLGLAGGSLNGSSGRAVMGWFTDADRGLAMSIRQTALPVGGAIGALLLPAIVSRHGFGPAYVLLSAMCLMTAAFAWVWLHEAPASTSAPSGGPGGRSSLLRDGTLWRFVFGIGALCVPQIALLSFIAVFLHDVAGFGLVGTTAAMVAYQCGSAVARVGAGCWTDRRRNRRAFLRGCAVLSVVSLATLAVATWLSGAGLLTTPGLLWGIAVFGGVVASCWHGVAFTELAVMAGPLRVGTALGLGNTFAFGAYFLTPLLVTAVLQSGSWAWAWGSVTVMTALSLRLLPPARAAQQSTRLGLVRGSDLDGSPGG